MCEDVVSCCWVVDRLGWLVLGGWWGWDGELVGGWLGVNLVGGWRNGMLLGGWWGGKLLSGWWGGKLFGYLFGWQVVG